MAPLNPRGTGPNQGSPHESRYYRAATPISVLALLVSCVAAGFSLWQATLTKEGNEITRSNNIVSQRAFIYTALSQIYLSPSPVNPTAVNFIFSLTNSGNTPTRNLIFFMKCARSADELQEPWSILYQGQDEIIQRPQFIGPHATVSAGCNLPIDQINEMIAGKLHGYIMIDITYHDQMNPEVRHATHLAQKLAQIVYTPTQTIAASEGRPAQLTPASLITSLEPRGRHNCADEECPN
jgi:hypothetical protein